MGLSAVCDCGISLKYSLFLAATESVEIPSSRRSEYFIQGKFHIQSFCSNNLAIVDPTKESFLSEKSIVVKAMVHVDNRVPLRLVKYGELAEKLDSGTHIARKKAIVL